MPFQLRTVRSWAADLVPTWLGGTWGSKLVSALALVGDSLIDTANEAGAVNLLRAPTFPSDALPRLASERLLERYPDETEDSYRARFLDAWNTWERAGTAAAIAAQYLAAGFIVDVLEAATSGTDLEDDPDGASRWNWDAPPPEAIASFNWSQFWLFVDGSRWTANTWGPARPNAARKWGEGTWGSNAPTTTINLLRRIERRWKPGHMRCRYIILALQPFDLALETLPDGTWNDPRRRSRRWLYVGG